MHKGMIVRVTRITKPRSVIILLGLLAALAGSAGAEQKPRADAANLRVPGSTVSVDSILDALDAREKSIKDISLRFEQKTSLKETGDAQTTSGRIRILRSPERFVVTFDSPAESTAAYDGKQLLLYFPDTGQAFSQKASLDDIGKLVGISPVSPIKQLGDRFKASLGGCSKSTCVLNFAEVGSEAVRWRILVDSKEWLVRGAVLENDEILIELNWFDFKVNQGLKASDFRIKLPENVVIEEGGPMFPFSGGM